MRLIVAAVGRMKAGPERLLYERYVERATALAPKAGVAQVQFREIEELRLKSAEARRAAEGQALIETAGRGAWFCALDERGGAVTSAAWAEEIARVRDEGQSTYVVALGGADGLDPEVRRNARSCIAFGAMTWPHQLARIMAAEQIYRCFTILSGHPYHRA